MTLTIANSAPLVGMLLTLARIGCATESASPSHPSAERRAFFGELHLHTAISLDAWTYGTKLMPDDAYRFGRGETIMVPAAQVAKQQGIASDRDIPATRAWPLDFMAVTDHSESMGTLLPLDDPTSPFSKSELGRRIVSKPSEAQRISGYHAIGRGSLPPELNDAHAMRQAWDVIVKAANDNYQPGRFTTFIAYEWSAIPNIKNLHRNVIFNGNHAPLPFSSDQSNRPEDLWRYLESVRAQGMDVLAIPHNANASGGLMFDWNDSDGKAIDEAYAQHRALNEPLTEIVQIKGQSETVPTLSPNDEFANFEIYDHVLGTSLIRSPAPGSYVRDALGRGLIVQSKVGANPFKYGLVGASDIHNGLSTSTENSFAGGHGGGVDPRTMLPQGNFATATRGVNRSRNFQSWRSTTPGQRRAGLWGAHGRMGRRKYARSHFRSAQAEGNLRHFWLTHSPAHVWRLGIRIKIAQRARVASSSLLTRRIHGWRSAGKACSHRFAHFYFAGDEGSGRGQSRSHSSHQGLARRHCVPGESLRRCRLGLSQDRPANRSRTVGRQYRRSEERHV